jgi:hypothetical protein
MTIARLTSPVRSSGRLHGVVCAGRLPLCPAHPEYWTAVYAYFGGLEGIVAGARLRP